MRIRIQIHPKTGELLLPENYQRPLTAALWLKANFPAEKESGAPKLICFSSLLFKNRKKEGNKIRLKGNQGSVLISSPLQTDIEKFYEIKGDIEIAGNICNIGKKEIVDSPVFQPEMTWQTLPNIGIVTQMPNKEDPAKKKQIYPLKDKENCENSLLYTLLFKWKRLCSEEKDRAIRWCENENPVEWAEKNLPKIEILYSACPKQETIKENAIISFWPGMIKVTGPEAWQRFIWDSGFGTKTGLGYGMIEPKL
jgi:CRISPR-associated endoribonuclease Cas6